MIITEMGITRLALYRFERRVNKALTEGYMLAEDIGVDTGLLGLRWIFTAVLRKEYKTK